CRPPVPRASSPRLPPANLTYTRSLPAALPILFVHQRRGKRRHRIDEHVGRRLGRLPHRIAHPAAGEVGGAASEEHPRQRLPHDRSEEHTSELQSRVDLVCRLLLEKKNKKKNRE